MKQLVKNIKEYQTLKKQIKKGEVTAKSYTRYLFLKGQLKTQFKWIL